MLLLALIMSICCNAIPHALYLSTCEIQIAEDYTWKGQLRIFHDDLEDAIDNQIGQRPHLTPDQVQEYDDVITTYINEHLLIGNEPGTSSISVIALVRNQDIVEIGLSGRLPAIKNNLQIRNDLLLEIFEAQKNVMMIRKSDEVRTLYFKKNHTTDQVDL